MSIKEVKDPFMFDGENKIALCPIEGNQAQFHCKGEVSWFFLSFGVNLGIFSSYGEDGPSKHTFVQRGQDSFLIARDTSVLS